MLPCPDPKDAIEPLRQRNNFVIPSDRLSAGSSVQFEDQLLDNAMALVGGIPREIGLFLLAFKIELNLYGMALMGDFFREISITWGHDISSLPEKADLPKVHIKALARGGNLAM
jgi:hypothetical protein